MYNIKKLKYNYNALEPYIDELTVNIHYNNHYKNYLDRLNKILIDNNFDFSYPVEEIFNHIEQFPLETRDDILFLAGGVVNHELYFDSMSPNKNNIPKGLLKDQIDKQYGSFSLFKEQFINTALKLVGSGYTFLVADRKNNLKIINTPNQDSPYSYGFTPLMTIDLWEHAYYLKYKYGKLDYILNFFEIVDFENTNKLYEKTIQKNKQK